MYVGDHYWQDGQPLSFSDGDGVFSHGKEMKGEPGEAPKYIRNESRWVMD